MTTRSDGRLVGPAGLLCRRSAMSSDVIGHDARSAPCSFDERGRYSGVSWKRRWSSPGLRGQTALMLMAPMTRHAMSHAEEPRQGHHVPPWGIEVCQYLFSVRRSRTAVSGPRAWRCQDGGRGKTPIGYVNMARVIFNAVHRVKTHD
jgi:hypothetical protein